MKKEEIFNELAKRNFTPKVGEAVIVYDAIIPELMENLQDQELKSLYPLRGLLVYNDPQKELHQQ